MTEFPRGDLPSPSGGTAEEQAELATLPVVDPSGEQ